MASDVYLVRLAEGEADQSIINKVGQLFRKAGISSIVQKDKPTAIKTHFGEKGNTSYVPSRFFRPIIEGIRRAGGEPFFVETSTLYRGQRQDAVKHFRIAEEHGFGFSETGCPLVFLDGLKGNHQIEVEVGLKHLETVGVAGDFPLVPAAVIVTHLTGHGFGLGGAIKNVAMGLTSRAGKLRQHESGFPRIEKARCTACGTCVEWCPEDAIRLGDVAVIDNAKCIGCGECLAVCPSEAVAFSWSESAESFCEKMAEAAYGILKGKMKNVAFITFIHHVTRDCNCARGSGDRVCEDLGVLASPDPVAIDQASVDLVNNACGKDLFEDMWPGCRYEAQLAHGEEIGLGSREYRLIEV